MSMARVSAMSASSVLSKPTARVVKQGYGIIFRPRHRRTARFRSSKGQPGETKRDRAQDIREIMGPEIDARNAHQRDEKSGTAKREDAVAPRPS